MSNDIAKLLVILNDFTKQIGEIIQQIEPQENSIFKEELISLDDENKSVLTTADSQGRILIEGAIDHIISFNKLIEFPPTTIAPSTCTRAVLESSALAAWLLAPKLNTKERLKRSFSLRYEGLIQQKKFGNIALHPEAQQEIVERINQVEKRANEIGIDTVYDKNERRIGIGINYPGITNLIDQQLKMEETYRLLSSVAHGHFWAIIKLGFIPSDEEPGMFRRELMFPIVLYLTFAIIDSLSIPVFYFTEISNHLVKEMRAVLNNTKSNLKKSFENKI